MGQSYRQNCDRAGLIGQFSTVVHASTAPGNNLMGFQLRLMDVVTNRFVGGDSDKVIAELATGLLRGDNVFQLHSIKCWMLVPGKLVKSDSTCGKPQFAVFVKLLKQVLIIHRCTLLERKSDNFLSFIILLNNQEIRLYKIAFYFTVGGQQINAATVLGLG